jgi:ribosomal protein S12 methylthiotransferase
MTGRHRSRPADEIVEEVRLLVKKGVKEFLLIAQDLTYYGIDTCKRPVLGELVRRISDVPGVEWIRLHYAYPSVNFPFDILDIIRERSNVCNYLDLALQHISDPVLKKMRRNITSAQTYDLLARIRDISPGIHLRTTLMVGHPGETARDFEELLGFVEKARFERMGAFMYSNEEGTYSFNNYKDDIDEKTKQSRLDALMSLQEGISASINREKTGKILKVIIDREEDSHYAGRTEYDSPEVDNEVFVSKDSRLVTGDFYKVCVKKTDTFDLYGEAIIS